MASLSLLITYYNEKELLTECLTSVYNQTVLPDEIIVYDDASSFPARDYVPHHPEIKIKIVRGERNIKTSAARNVLLNMASSDYLHFHDADDLLEPFCIETLKVNIDKNPSELYINEIRAIKLETKEELDAIVLQLESLKQGQDIVDYAIQGCLLLPSTTFKKDTALRLGGFKEGQLLQSEDYEFNIRLVYNSKDLQIITRPLVIQRVRDNSLSTNADECYTEGVKALKLMVNYLPAKYYPSIAKRASSMGRILFQIGNVKEAKNAFDFAKRLDAAPYRNENFFYKFLSDTCGQLTAERISSLYRKLIPKKLRARLSF